jgi:hypothetical protein
MYSEKWKFSVTNVIQDIQTVKRIGQKYYILLKIANLDVHVHPNNEKTRPEILHNATNYQLECACTPKQPKASPGNIMQG